MADYQGGAYELDEHQRELVREALSYMADNNPESDLADIYGTSRDELAAVRGLFD